MRSAQVIFLWMIMIFVSVNGVPLKEAWMNYRLGKSNREFWLAESMSLLGMSGSIIGGALMTPLILSGNPLIIARVVSDLMVLGAGMGAVGGAGALYNRPAWMQVPQWMRAAVDTDSNTPSSTPVSFPTTTGTPTSSPATSPITTTATTAVVEKQPAIEAIVPIIMLAGLVGAGYKIYQWLTAKKDKTVKKQEQPVEPVVPVKSEEPAEQNVVVGTQ